MLELLAWAGLALAAVPAAMTAVNLAVFRAPPAPPARARPRISLLVPARDEEASIDDALHAALASRGVELEVLVLDDGSTDRTAAIVAEHAGRDSRLRLVPGRPLPPGWCGKQNACHMLARHATGSILVFIDADVRLAPDALARIAHLLIHGDAALVSGFPREETLTAPEWLVVPMIHVLLIGYLPIPAARWFRHPAFGAGCGQIIAARREAYDRAGGHAAISASRHDGLTLPRAFRRAGFLTDIFDASDLAHCRMYRGARETFTGFMKNATEGMATPAGLPLWTVLLAGGHIMPFVLLASSLVAGDELATRISALAAAIIYLARGAIAGRFRQRWSSVILHPVGVAVLLALQWIALWRSCRGRPVVWRARTYVD